MTRSVYRDLGGKRIFDLGIAVVLFPIWILVTGVLYFLVFAFIGSPVIFRQTRSGKRGREFELLKFRTMRPDASGNLADEDRILPLGRVLRRWSLDELPEYVNIVRGEMSFVGPRPLLPQYLTRYSDRQLARLSVLPGLTGLAQVSGRNNLGWDETFELDVLYVSRISLMEDIRILLKTFIVMAHGRGAGYDGESSRGEFRG